ncbi:MAG: hypothetical protein HY650_08415 [Acidobacteria bacterium]|nr:hypothetical protein [Acidobacteriota bacterium]
MNRSETNLMSGRRSDRSRSAEGSLIGSGHDNRNLHPWRKSMPLIWILFWLALLGPATRASDIVSAGTGLWDAPSTWKGGMVPGAGDHVFVEAGHSVSLMSDQFCADLNLHAVGGQKRLVTGPFRLQVGGKLRAFTGAAPGAGTSSLPSSPGWIDTAGGGRIVAVGNSRALTLAGEWGANPPGWNLVIAAAPRQTLTCNTALKAGNIQVVSGTLAMNGALRLAPDHGSVGSGSVAVEAGAVLQLGSNASIQRVAAASLTSHCGSVLIRGTLSFPGTVGPIGAARVEFSGTVEYTAASAQTLVTRGGNAAGAEPSQYMDLRIGGSGAKSLGVPTQIDGTLSVTGTASLSAGGHALFYGEASTLEYSGTEAQETSDAEFPPTGGPRHLRIANPAGVTLHASRMVGGVLALVVGDLIAGPNVLTQGGTSTGSGDVVGTVRRFDLGRTPRSFGNPHNTITFESDVAPSSMDVKLIKSSPAGFAQAVLRTYVMTPQGGDEAIGTIRLRYLDGELNGNNEAGLALFRFDGQQWILHQKTDADETENWVQCTGLRPSSSWTISSSTIPAVVLVHLFAVIDRDTIVLHWETIDESSTAGFNILSSAGGNDAATCVNREVIEARASGLHEGLRYRYRDRTPPSAGQRRYWLERVLINGSREVYGPVGPGGS